MTWILIKLQKKKNPQRISSSYRLKTKETRNPRKPLFPQEY